MKRDEGWEVSSFGPREKSIRSGFRQLHECPRVACFHLQPSIDVVGDYSQISLVNLIFIL